MSLVTDESFAAGIPAGFFGATESAGGTPTVTYVAGQGVDLACGASVSGWFPVTAAGALASLAIEIDCEFTASAGATPAYQWGLGTKRGSGAVGNYAAVLMHDNAGAPNDLQAMQYPAVMTTGTQAATRAVKDQANAVGATAPWPVALNERRRLRLDWDATKAAGQFTVDDVPIYQFPSGIYPFSSPTAFPEIYVFNATLRVHRVRIWDAASLLALAASVPTIRIPVTPAVAPPVTGSTYTIRPVPRGYFPSTSGGVIEGVVVHDNSPGADVVQSAPVLLIDCLTQQICASTVSDPLTGKYQFSGLDTAREYLVLSRDMTRTFNAVVKDRILPV